MELRKERYLVTFRVAPEATLALNRQLIPSLIIDGYSVRLIGEQLRISRRTVKNHMRSVYLRAGIQKRNKKAQIVRMKCPRLLYQS
jgi:DNA-binding NarL/FixJ family response regulator